LTSVAELLERQGAKPPRYGRGKWRCPKHDGTPSLKVDVDGGWFKCWHGGCDWKGNTFTLEREMGLGRPWIPASEYRKTIRDKRCAEGLAALVRARRLDLLDEQRALNELEFQINVAALKRDDDPVFWDALSFLHRRRPRVLAEISLVEDAPTALLVRYLHGTARERDEAVDAVLERGGVADRWGRWREASCF
jgi:hypothetical protein